MKIKYKLKTYLILFLLLACITGLVGFILLIKSSQVKADKIDYEEKTKLNYNVYLEENYNNKEYLDEGMQYKSDMIDNILLEYNYQINYSKKINLDVNNKVDTTIKIVDSSDNEKVIYEKNEKLSSKSEFKKKTDNVYVNKKIKIDYQKYKKLGNDLKAKFNISTDCKLIINFVTKVNNKKDYVDSIEKSKIMTVEIPLTEEMVTIKKSSNSREKSFYMVSTKVPFINKVMSIGSYVLFGLTLIFVVTSMYLLFRINRLTGEFEKYIEKLLKQYDAYITESSSKIKLKEDVIYVKSFKELLDVRNNVEKAIVYNKVDENVTRFIVIDENQEFCYEVNKKEFE